MIDTEVNERRETWRHWTESPKTGDEEPPTILTEDERHVWKSSMNTGVVVAHKFRRERHVVPGPKGHLRESLLPFLFLEMFSRRKKGSRSKFDTGDRDTATIVRRRACISHDDLIEKEQHGSQSPWTARFQSLNRRGKDSEAVVLQQARSSLSPSILSLDTRG